MVNPKMSRRHRRMIGLHLRTGQGEVKNGLSFGELAELDAGRRLLRDLIAGLDLITHFTF